MAYLLGIDLGTSSVKCMLADEHGKTVCLTSRKYNIVIKQAGWAEQSPDTWWSATKEAIAELLLSSQIQPEFIKGIGLSGQMHGLVMVDKDGKPIHNAIIWTDQRTSSEVAEIKEILGAERLGEAALSPLASGFLLPSLYWIKKHAPDVYRNIYKVMLPKDYVRYCLTGEIGTDFSDASGTLAFDCVRREWLWDFLDKLDISHSLFPKCYPSAEIAGNVCRRAADETGLSTKTQVIYGGGDQPMQSVGNGIIEKGMVSANIGTGSQISSPITQPLYDSKLRTQTFCHVLDGYWNIMGASLCGGLSLNWFRDKFMSDFSFQELSQMVKDIPAGSEGLLFLPYLNGERTPYLDDDAKGVFFGIRLDHNAAHFARSVMEGVAFALNMSMELLKENKIQIENVIASGGGASSQEWLQIQADIYGTPLHTAHVCEQACQGAIVVASYAVGMYSSIAEACKAMVNINNAVVIPNQSNTTMYQEKYQIFKELYSRNKDLFPLL